MKHGSGMLVRAAVESNPKLGVLVDYETLSGTTNDFVFRSDTTYYISGSFVSLNSAIVFEGGAVIKNATNGSIQIIDGAGGGSTLFKTSPYRPVVFTAKDDNSVGSTIAGSTGAPTNYYGQPALYLFTYDVAMAYARFSYAKQALQVDSDFYHLYFDHLQFVSCQTAIQPFDSYYHFRNLLLNNISSNCFDGFTFHIDAEHITAHNCRAFVNNSYPSNGAYDFALTNSLLVQVTNLGNVSVTTNQVVQLSDDSGVFQTVGAAAHYLAANSPYRNIGNNKHQYKSARWT